MPKLATAEEPAALLTMADLAARFSLPESTARYYCRRFNAFLPQEGEGRRRYKPEAVQVLAAIKEAMGRTKHARSVEMELGLRFAPNMREPALTPDVALVPLPPESSPAPILRELTVGFLQALAAQTNALERIADALTEGASPAALKTTKTALPSSESLPPAMENTDPLNAEIESLRKEIKNLRGLMSSSEEIHQQDVEQLRKWLNRLGASQEGKSGGE